jgi:T5SS/PEP-CTERM-associated repeat protein
VNVNGAASIGASGAGDLSVGGTFATTGAMVLGVGSTGSGAVSVAGVGSDLAVGGQLDLGGGTQAGGTGALTVGSGGTLSAASAVLFGGGALLVDAGGVAEIGTGSTQVAGKLIVNAGMTAGTGVDVSGVGSTVILGPDGMVLGDGATGFLTVQSGATLADGGVADIGLGGTGKLSVVTGAQFVSVGAELGVLASSTPGSGTIGVNAATWISSGQIEVGAGAGGSALLRIENGATLQASVTLAASTPFLFVDENVTGQAMVDVGTAVVDAGSNSVDIGETGFGTLTLHDGAVLDAGSAGGSAAFVLGDQGGANGTATLTGAGTTVHVSGAATVGAAGAGTLSIGGTFVTTGEFGLGIGATGHGVATVAGTGSELAIGGQLDLGGVTQAGGTGILTVGSGGVVTAASLELFGGGTLAVGAGGIAEIGSGGTRIAGQLVVDAGVTAGGSGEVAAAVTNQGSLVAQNGTLVVTGPASGAGSYEVAGGAVLQLDQPGDVTLGFVATSGTIVLGAASGAADILQMSSNDTLRLIGLGSSPEVSYAGDTATITGSGGSWALTFAGAPPNLHVTSQGSDALVLACYVEGTAIGTPEGPVAIEGLAVGDRVLTAAGPARAIVWLGRCEVDCRNHPTPRRVWPVRVAPHAFGPGMPGRPLFLSPDHAVFVDDVLIPVRYLIDGGAIRQVERSVLTYWHLELESHDVVLAEGLPAESFLGDREQFSAMARFGLYPDFTSLHWEACGYAPLVVTGPALARVRARIGGEAVGALA